MVSNLVPLWDVVPKVSTVFLPFPPLPLSLLERPTQFQAQLLSYQGSLDWEQTHQLFTNFTTKDCPSKVYQIH